MTRCSGGRVFVFAIVSAALACSTFVGEDEKSGPVGPNPDPDGGQPPVTGDPLRGLEVTVGDGKSTAFVMQGRSLSLPVKLTRKGTSTRPVAITVSKLPKDVTADPLVIPEGAVEATLTLRAAATSPQGPASLEITALEEGPQPSGALAKVSAFVRGTPGALDTTFATTGMLLHPYGNVSDTSAEDAKVLRDGSIVVGARRLNTFILSRFTSAGVLDAKFGSLGGGTMNLMVTQTSALLDVYEPAAPAKGHIWALETGNGTYSVHLFRVNLDGSLDTGFNGSGSATLDASSTLGRQVLALPDGKALVIAGDSNTTTITRWNADGTRDDSYGTGGTCPVGGSGPRRMTARPGGGVFVTLSSGTDSSLMGCTATGAIDTSIGVGPSYHADIGQGVVDLARMSDGGFIFVGDVTPIAPNAPYSYWKRVSPLFLQTAAVTVTGPLTPIGAYAIQPDGGVLLNSPGDPADFGVIHYTPAGKLDTDFGTNGTATFKVAGDNSAVLNRLVVQPDGRILALGKHYDTVDAAIVRFWP